MNIRNNQQSLRCLIAYLIVSLLFAVSVKLHVHGGDTAAYATHGSSVAISTPDHLSSVHHQLLGEIEVNLDKFPKNPAKTFNDACLSNTAPFIMPASFYCLGVLTEISQPISLLAFAGTPPLRAPPV